MKLNYEKGKNVRREIQQEFRGINHKIRANDHELETALNLSASEYPALKTRGERNYITDIGRCRFPSLCRLGDGSIAYISRKDNRYHICVNGIKVYTFDISESEPEKMVRMGEYLCVFPNGIVYNVKDRTAKHIKSKIGNETNGKISIYPSRIDGKTAAISDVEPVSAVVGDVWYDTKSDTMKLCSGLYDGWENQNAVIYVNDMDFSMSSARPEYAVQFTSVTGGIPDQSTGTLRVYNGASYETVGTVERVFQLPKTAEADTFVVLSNRSTRINSLYLYRNQKPKWTDIATSFSKISAELVDISEYFSVGDVIKVGEYGYVRVYTSEAATENNKGFIVVEGIDAVGEFEYASTPLEISRDMPENMRNIIECSNRLWATDSQGREIYACKLGDPFNWNAFSGLASDSYAISVGSGGVFTAGISYDGYPHFFKENSVTKIYGNYPFRLYTTECPGVAVGCEKSLAVLKGSLVYKSISGFYAYSGGYPKLISEDISDMCGHNCKITASGSDERAYYAAAEGALLVYENGLWHLQDAPKRTVDICNYGRGTVAVFAAEDDVGTYTVPTLYIVTLEGLAPSFMTSKGSFMLEKAFDVIASEHDGARVFVAGATVLDLEIGSMFAVNGEIFSIKALTDLGKTCVIDVGGIDSDDIVTGDSYVAYVYKIDSLPWQMCTVRQGLYTPDDKWYTRFVFRYMSESSVQGAIVYDDGKEFKFTLPAKERTGSYAITLSPSKVEYINISLRGEGKFALLSISKNIEEGDTP